MRKHARIDPEYRKMSKEPAVRTIRWAISFTVFLILIITIALFSALEVLFDTTHLLTRIGAGRFLTLLLCATASLVIGGLFTYIILYFPMRPIKRLLSGMRRLADGHFEERLDFGSFAPLREMSDTFNTLARELQNTEMLRSDFVNNLSHEFKTPIVSIRGFARLLKKNTLTEEERREYIDIIASESGRLANMAANVLNLSKIEQQSILTQSAEFNLSEQLRQCILLFEKKWTEKALEPVADFPEIILRGNEEMLKQVWLNLLDNAIRFSPKGAPLVVSAPVSDSYVKITFTNFGPKITEYEKKRIYDKFWQGDASRTSEGAGIGMSIVKKIVDLHKGAIEIDSTEERTSFTVLLPKNNCPSKHRKKRGMRTAAGPIEKAAPGI